MKRMGKCDNVGTVLMLPFKDSGQIIATSHEFSPPNGGLVREIPLFQGNPGW